MLSVCVSSQLLVSVLFIAVSTNTKISNFSYTRNKKFRLCYLPNTCALIYCDYSAATFLLFLPNHKRFEVQCLGSPRTNYQLHSVSLLLCRCDNILVLFFVNNCL